MSEQIPQSDRVIEPVVPTTSGMTTRVVKGSMWTLAGQVAPLAVSLVTTPFVIRLLGAESYGVLILVGLIPAYLGFADFGMSMASTKFASEAYAEGDREKEARIVRTAALIALMSSVPVAALLLIFSGSIIGWFAVPGELEAEASLALKFAAVTFVANFLNGVFNTPQLSRLRMDLNTFINAGFRIAGLLAVPTVIYFFGGVAVAIFALMVVSLLTLAGHLFTSRGLLRELAGITIDVSMVRPMLKVGAGLVVAGVAAVVLVNAEKGVLAATVSSAALAHYSVAFTLASMMTMFSAAMIQSLIPAFSQLQTDDKREQLVSLYSRGIKMTAILSIPALVFLSLIARPFFTVWAGPEFGEKSTLPFFILLAGLVFNLVAYFPYAVIMASGRTDLFAKLYWIEVLPYCILVWLLSIRFGAIGAAIAWSVRIIVDTFFQFYLARKLAGVRYSDSGRIWILPAAASISVPLVVYYFLGAANIVFVLSALICPIVYGTIVWQKALSSDETLWLSRRLRSIF